jgi:RNA polymerase sigma factor (sigma-70 family)
MRAAALHRLGGDRRLAEDAVQVAMVKAWRAASTYDPARPLAPWLHAIVRRCAIDLGRQEQRHRALPLDAAAAQSAASNGDGFESAVAAWAVREVLRALAAREYAVTRLSSFEGLTRRDRRTADHPGWDGEVAFGTGAPPAARRARVGTRSPDDRGDPTRAIDRARRVPA